MMDEDSQGRDRQSADVGLGTHRRPAWVRPVKIAAGVLLLPLGIVGLFLPFLQGVLFLLISLALLTSEVPFLKRFRDRLHDRYPHVFQRSHDASQSFFQRVSAFLRRSRGQERERDDRA